MGNLERGNGCILLGEVGDRKSTDCKLKECPFFAWKEGKVRVLSIPQKEAHTQCQLVCRLRYVPFFTIGAMLPIGDLFLIRQPVRGTNQIAITVTCHTDSHGTFVEIRVKPD